MNNLFTQYECNTPGIIINGVEFESIDDLCLLLAVPLMKVLVSDSIFVYLKHILVSTDIFTSKPTSKSLSVNDGKIPFIHDIISRRQYWVTFCKNNSHSAPKKYKKIHNIFFAISFRGITWAIKISVQAQKIAYKSFYERNRISSRNVKCARRARGGRSRTWQGNISQPTLAPRHVLNKKRRETKCRLRLIWNVFNFLEKCCKSDECKRCYSLSALLSSFYYH